MYLFEQSRYDLSRAALIILNDTMKYGPCAKGVMIIYETLIRTINIQYTTVHTEGGGDKDIQQTKFEFCNQEF